MRFECASVVIGLNRIWNNFDRTRNLKANFEPMSTDLPENYS